MNKPDPFLPHEEDDTASRIAAVERGRADIVAGRTVPYEAVRKWLLSWGSENEVPPPECP